MGKRRQKREATTAGGALAAEMAFILNRHEICPPRRQKQQQGQKAVNTTDPTTRKRVAAAINSARYINDAQQLIPANDTAEEATRSYPQVVLFRGGSWEAAAWVSEQLETFIACPVPPMDKQNCKNNRDWSILTSKQIERWRKPLVLDFASDSNPGGGWRGNQVGTQEEELCRLSSPGLALERLGQEGGHAAGGYSIPTHGCVYVEDVVVVRNADATWRNPPLWCSVVAAALRHADGRANFIQTKVRGVLAAAEGHGAFIGGGWGCGAFGNDAEEVAEAWRVTALRAPESLAYLVLALPNKQMCQAFRAVFCDALVIDGS